MLIAFQVLSLEDILVKEPSVAQYLPRPWRSFWNRKTQVFPFLAEKVKETIEKKYDKNTSDYPVTKICVKPCEGSVNQHQVDSNVSAFSKMSKHGKHSAYLYDEDKGTKGAALGISIPG